MAHTIAGQRRAGRHDHARRARHRHGDRHRADAGGVKVGGGEDRPHAGRGPRRTGVDAANIGESVRRANESAPQRARCAFVILKIARAGEEPVILQPPLERSVHYFFLMRRS
jgi:hypothetical protein